MLTMYQQITIKTLKSQGKTNKEIAREFNCHRNTVRNIIQREALIEKQTRQKSSYFDQYREKIKELLDKGITKLRIFEILRDEEQIDHSYVTLCTYIRQHFGKKPAAYVVQTSTAGEEAEVDFGYLGFVPDGNGGMKKAYAFVMTLCFSRVSFYGVVYDQSVASLIQALQQAFSFFGGVPKRVKIDNLKAAILKNRRYDLEFNQTFLEFAYHYGFVIVPCTPYHPQQKGKVERGVGYVKTNFLPGRTVTNPQDVQRQLALWMEKVNGRVHGTTRQVPQEVFQREEKHLLHPLPAPPFTFYQTATRLVKPNCHINLNNVYYSVPATFVGRQVEVRWQGKIVKIIADHEEVARHLLTDKPGTFVTNPNHFPDGTVYSHTTYQAKYEEKMRTIGSHAHAFFRHVVTSDPQGWNRTVRKILGLAHVYGSYRVDMALRRALFFSAFHASTIQRILERNLEQAPVEPQLVAHRRLTTAAGASLIAQRALPAHGAADATTVIPMTQDGGGFARDLAYYACVGIRKEDEAEKTGSVLP